MKLRRVFERQEQFRNEMWGEISRRTKFEGEWSFWGIQLFLWEQGVVSILQQLLGHTGPWWMIYYCMELAEVQNVPKHAFPINFQRMQNNFVFLKRVKFGSDKQISGVWRFWSYNLVLSWVQRIEIPWTEMSHHTINSQLPQNVLIAIVTCAFSWDGSSGSGALRMSS
jgi:hypothetical protein